MTLKKYRNDYSWEHIVSSTSDDSLSLVSADVK